MRVLCLATEFPPAHGYGLGRYTYEHCQALAAAGAEVHVVCNNYDAARGAYRDGGVQVLNVPFLLPFQGYNSTADILQGNVTLFTRAAALLREHGPYDVIQTHDWLAASAGVALRGTFEVPLVVTMHDTEVGKRLGEPTPEQDYVAQMEGWICEKAEAVCANSDFLKQELTAAYAVAVERITVVGCGVNPERFVVDVDPRLFKSLFGGPDEALLLFVGRLVPIKGPQVLLEALPKILSFLPAARLVLAGEGPLREPLQRRAQELGLSERVRFLGHVQGQPLAALYRCADVLVVPSLYEPLGMVALEGMVCRTPIVAADTGGLAEIVEEERTGLKVPPNDPHALACAIVRLQATPALGREMSGNGQRQAIEHHDWSEVARRSLDLYDTLSS